MKYENLTLDEERALYGVCGAEVTGCTFAGPADGKSALKECRSIQVKGCSFLLRYPSIPIRIVILLYGIWKNRRCKIRDEGQKEDRIHHSVFLFIL